MPEDYIERLADKPQLTKSVLLYLTVSNGIAETPEFSEFALRTRALLERLQREDTRAACQFLPGELARLFERRHALLLDHALHSR